MRVTTFITIAEALFVRLAISQTPAVTTTVIPATTATSTFATISTEAALSACGIISTLSAQWESLNPSATTVPIVPIQDAYDCLNSVPIIETDALALIDGIIPYVQFQSTLAYLKNPPEGYPIPAVDVLEDLQKIKQNVTSGVYSGEYAFQLDLWRTINSAHDSHLVWVGDVLVSALRFALPYQFASVSGDGKTPPSVYLLEDVKLPAGQSQLSYTPSPVSSINGQNAVEFLDTISLENNLHDLDALYNTNFFEIAQIPVNLGQYSPPAFQFPGSTTTFRFANGTSRRYLNEAFVVNDFSNVDSGEAFYHKFCRGNKTQSSLYKTLNDPSRIPPGYPDPVVIHSNYIVGGYFLNETGYTDVAVLSVLGFSPTEPSGGPEFQSVIQNFLAAAQAANKTKLIVDLQANGGGILPLAYELFLQLFPTIEPYGASLYRAHDGLDFLGQGISRAAQNATSRFPNDIQLQEREGASLPLNYAADLSITGESFNSWAEMYGPQRSYGDNFTTLTRLNLTDPLLAFDVAPNIVFTGFGNRSNFTTSPFAAGNIIMLTDGFCSSSCAVFAEFMKTQANVKSAVLGGRPGNKGAMQAVGGTKGFQDEPFDAIYEFIKVAAGLPEFASEKLIDQYIKQNLAGTDLANVSSYALRRTINGGVNFKSNIRINDTTLTPLQFVYEAADCRLWYTPKMINDITEIWRVAAHAAWNDSSICVNGSLGAPSSSSSDDIFFENMTSTTALLYGESSTSAYDDGTMASFVPLSTGAAASFIGTGSLMVTPPLSTGAAPASTGIAPSSPGLTPSGSIGDLSTSSAVSPTNWSMASSAPAHTATTTSGGIRLHMIAWSFLVPAFGGTLAVLL